MMPHTLVTKQHLEHFGPITLILMPIELTHYTNKDSFLQILKNNYPAIV